MKARPRSVERRVAEVLSDVLFTPLGLAPVRRIPVLGKEGPDIETNAFGLAIDVKSRLQVPVSFILDNSDEIIDFPDLFAVRLEYVAAFLEKYPYLTHTIAWSQSVTVVRWMDHMAEWCATKPDLVPILVLHKPGMDVKKSTFLIRKGDVRKLHEKYNQLKRYSSAVDQPEPCSGAH